MFWFFKPSCSNIIICILYFKIITFLCFQLLFICIFSIIVWKLWNLTIVQGSIRFAVCLDIGPRYFCKLDIFPWVIVILFFNFPLKSFEFVFVFGVLSFFDGSLYYIRNCKNNNKSSTHKNHLVHVALFFGWHIYY